MKRYIKVKNKWLDTLEDQKRGIIYFVFKKKVVKWTLATNIERRIGHLQAETDNLRDFISQEAK